MSDYIVIAGNPLDGMNFFGPFESFLKAREWAKGIPDHWVTELETP